MAVPRTEGLRREDFQNRRTLNVRRGRFVITAACAGAPVNLPFLSALQTYCEARGAQLRILPMRAHREPMQPQPGFYDTALYPFIEQRFMATEVKFNENLKAIDLQINPQQVDPLAGIARIGRSSLLVAHPVPAMRVVAHSNSGLPRMVHTTGVCTNPTYLVNRTGLLARQGHRLGAVVVELDGDRFHLRQLQADTDGSVVDLGLRYSPDGSVDTQQAETFVLGDLHAGQHDPSAIAAWEEIAAFTRPKLTFVHDLFNGLSINHHMEHDQLSRIKVPFHLDTLDKELFVTRDLLEHVSEWVPEGRVVVVPSNHNDWVYDYLTEGKWVRDRINYAASHRMVGHVLNGRNPLAAEIDPDGKALWLDRDQDLFICGIQHACHGDKGPNGAKGSYNNLEQSYGAGTYGHVHTPGILRESWFVGTSSLLKQGWNSGASGWLHSSVLTYPSVSGGIGLRQMITSLEGEFTCD
jgi:hypothetical protein